MGMGWGREAQTWVLGDRAPWGLEKEKTGCRRSPAGSMPARKELGE